MKKLFTIIGGIILTLVVIGVIKDQIVKSIVTTAGSEIIGAPVHIGSMSISIFKQSVVIKDLKLYNPPGFDKEVFLEMPTITVDYDSHIQP